MPIVSRLVATILDSRARMLLEVLFQSIVV